MSGPPNGRRPVSARADDAHRGLTSRDRFGERLPARDRDEELDHHHRPDDERHRDVLLELRVLPEPFVGEDAHRQKDRHRDVEDDDAHRYRRCDEAILVVDEEREPEDHEHDDRREDAEDEDEREDADPAGRPEEPQEVRREGTFCRARCHTNAPTTPSAMSGASTVIRSRVVSVRRKMTMVPRAPRGSWSRDRTPARATPPRRGGRRPSP